MRLQAIAKHNWGTPRAWVSVTALLLGGVVLSGCHTDMWNQDKLKPFTQSDFFADQSADRPLVEHTVSIGDGKIKAEDPGYYTGLLNGKPIPTIPTRAVASFKSPSEMLERGQDRYNAYCSPCHGKTGDGNGFIMQRGLGYWQKLAASYHTTRLRKTQDGHIYDVLTNGFGVMYSYGARIQDPNDRWAVVAYVRALQLTRANQPPAPDPYGGKTPTTEAVAPTAPDAAPANPTSAPSNLTTPDAAAPVATPVPQLTPKTQEAPMNPGATTP